jgi:hypothetical protein
LRRSACASSDLAYEAVHHLERIAAGNVIGYDNSVMILQLAEIALRHASEALLATSIPYV